MDSVRLTLCLQGLDRNISCIDLIGIFGCHFEDTLLVDVEGYDDVRLTSWSFWNIIKNNLAQLSTLSGELAVLAITLEDSEMDLRRIVHHSGVGLGGKERKLSILRNHDTHPVNIFGFFDLDTKVEWGHINGLGVPLGSFSHLSAQECGSVGNCFIWVDLVVELFTAEFLGEHRLHFWDTGASSNEYDLVNIVYCHFGAFECFINDWKRLFNEPITDLFELFTSKNVFKVCVLG